MKLIVIFSLISFFFLISCSNNTNSIESNEKTIRYAEEQNEKKKQKKRLQILNTLTKQYNASNRFDTVRFKMTYQYQNLLQQNDRVIIDNFKIIDIEKIDSVYFVSIQKGNSRKRLIDFTCNQSQIEKLCPDILNDGTIKYYIDDKFLILKLYSIKKLKFKLSSIGEVDDEYYTSSYIELENSDVFIFKGVLIDIFSNSLN